MTKQTPGKVVEHSFNRNGNLEIKIKNFDGELFEELYEPIDYTGNSPIIRQFNNGSSLSEPPSEKTVMRKHVFSDGFFGATFETSSDMYRQVYRIKLKQKLSS